VAGWLLALLCRGTSLTPGGWIVSAVGRWPRSSFEILSGTFSSEMTLFTERLRPELLALMQSVGSLVRLIPEDRVKVITNT
jgi:hypothetical protein